MKVALAVALLSLVGCASEKLALAPPAGVDFSGHWQLNEAESDDPMRLLLSQNAIPPTAPSGAGGGGQGGGGRGGRGAPGGGLGGPGAPGPAMPSVGALSEGLRWPGKELEVKQTGGVVTIASAGVSQVYRPMAKGGHHGHHRPSDDDRPPDRDMHVRGRGDGPPARCGWDEQVLVVQAGGPDDDGPSFEQRYSLSQNGQRLIEVVAFQGGRTGGYTVSKVWERAAPSTGAARSQ